MEKSHQHAQPNSISVKKLQQQAESQVKDFISTGKIIQIPYEMIIDNHYCYGTASDKNSNQNPSTLIITRKYNCITISDKNVPGFRLQVDGVNQGSIEGIHYIDIKLLKKIISLIFSNDLINTSAIKSAIVQQLFPYLPSNAYLFLLAFLKQYKDMARTCREKEKIKYILVGKRGIEYIPIDGVDYILVLEKAIAHLPIENGFYNKTILTLVKAELKIALGIEYIKLAFASKNNSNSTEFLEKANNYLQSSNNDLSDESQTAAKNDENDIVSLQAEIKTLIKITQAEIAKREVIVLITQLAATYTTDSNKTFRLSLDQSEKIKRSNIVSYAQSVQTYLSKPEKLSSDEYEILVAKIYILCQDNKAIPKSGSKNFYPCLKKLIEALENQSFKDYVDSLNPKNSKENNSFSAVIKKRIALTDKKVETKAIEESQNPILQRRIILEDKIKEIYAWFQTGEKKDGHLEFISSGEFSGNGIWEIDVADYSFRVSTSQGISALKTSLKTSSSTSTAKEIKFLETEGLKHIFLIVLNDKIPKACKVALAKTLFAYLPTDTYFIYSKLLLEDATKKRFADFDYLDILLHCVKSFPFNNDAYEHENEVSYFTKLLRDIANQYIKGIQEQSIPLETRREHGMSILDTMLNVDKHFPKISKADDFQVILKKLFQGCIKLAIELLSAWKPKKLASKHNAEEIGKRQRIINQAKNIVRDNEINQEKIERFIKENDEKNDEEIIIKKISLSSVIGESKSFQPSLKELIKILKQYQDYCRRKELVSGIEPDKIASNESTSSSSRYKSDYDVVMELQESIRAEYKESFPETASSNIKEKQNDFSNKNSNCKFDNLPEFLIRDSGDEISIKENYDYIDIAYLKEIISTVFKPLENENIYYKRFYLIKNLFPYLTTEAYLFFLEYLNTCKIHHSGKQYLLNAAIEHLPLDNGLYPKSVLIIIQAELEIALGEAYLNKAQTSKIDYDKNSIEEARKYLEEGCGELKNVITSEEKVNEINFLFTTIELLSWKNTLQTQIDRIQADVNRYADSNKQEKATEQLNTISKLLREQTEFPPSIVLETKNSHKKKQELSTPTNLSQWEKLKEAVKSFNGMNLIDYGPEDYLAKIDKIELFLPKSPNTISVAEPPASKPILIKPKMLWQWLEKENSKSKEKISCLKKQGDLSHCWQLNINKLELNIYVKEDTYPILDLKPKFIEIEKLKFILLVFLDDGIESQCKIDLAKALFAHLPTKTYITYFNLLLESKICQNFEKEAYLDILFAGLKQFPLVNGIFDQEKQKECLTEFKNKVVEKYPLNDAYWSSAKDNALMLKNMSHMFDLYQELKIDIDDKFKQAMKKLFHACIRWIVNDLNNWTPALFSTTFNKSDKTERRRVVKESVINLISGDEISRDTLINCLVLITDEIEEDKKSKLGKSEKFVPQLRQLDKLLRKYFDYCLKEGPDDSLEKAMLSARRKMDEMRVQKDVVDGENGDEELKDMAKTPG